MYFANFRNKFGLSFLVFVIVLFSTVLMAFGTIKSSADSDNEKRQGENFSFTDLQNQQIFSNSKEFTGFNFLSNNPAALFNDSKSVQSALSKDGANADVYGEFDKWVKSYTAKTANGLQIDSQQIDEGEALAIRRREQLKQLIQTNPQAAIERAISAETLALLPSSIAEQSERRINATGDFMVYEVCGINSGLSAGKKGVRMGSSRTEREVVIGEDKYTAYVYGRREQMTTKLAIPLSGIEIDGQMAVDEAVGQTIKGSDAAAKVGGETKYFADRTAMDEYFADEVKWESQIGPKRESAATKGKEKTAVSGRAETEAPEATASSWTEGPKTVLMIRAEFSDKPGDPVSYDNQTLTVTSAQNLFTNEVNPFYLANSYGKTSITATVTSSLILMPHPLSYYTQGNNSDELIPDARAAALQKGYNTNNYDFDIVAFSYTSAFDWVGLSSIGAKGSKLNGGFSLEDVAHELGHNYGLLHANLWRTTDGTTTGQGYDIEYGDCYDMMANHFTCNITQNSHFNATYKHLLNWLTDAADVETVTPDKTNYTIYAQDATSGSGIRALKINKDGTKNYWVEFRQGMNGALIRWDLGSQSFKQTELLDMNPTTSTINDAALAVGQSFFDGTKGIRITVLSKGNTTPESLNLKVETNLPIDGCVYSLSSTSFNAFATGQTGSTSIITRADCAWTATSSNSWITFPGATSGSGNGTIAFAVANNPGATTRYGTITVGGQIFTITQPSNSCAGSINFASLNFPASGGNLTYTHGCVSITPVSAGSSDWININTNPITISPNSGGARTGNLVLRIEDTNGNSFSQSFPVNQAGQTNCTFPLNPTSKSFNSSGGTGVFSINSSDSTCSTTYSAISNSSWINISSAAGQSSDNIVYTVSQNSGASRTGTITVTNPITGSQTLTVSQDASGCAISLSSPNNNFGESGGVGVLNVSSGANCPTPVTSNNSWIIITEPGNGTGGGTVKFLVGSNSSSARSGSITVANGSTFIVSQTAGAGKSHKRVRFF